MEIIRSGLVVRSADDIVVAFEHEADARRFPDRDASTRGRGREDAASKDRRRGALRSTTDPHLAILTGRKAKRCCSSSVPAGSTRALISGATVIDVRKAD